MLCLFHLSANAQKIYGNSEVSVFSDEDKLGAAPVKLTCNSADANSCPWNTQATKYIAVNFHYFCQPDGSGNFNEYNDGNTPSLTNETAYTRAEKIFKEINEQLNENTKMFNSSEDAPTCKLKMQLVLKGVYVHRGNYVPDYATKDANGELDVTYTGSNPAFYDNSLKVNPDSEINCFFYPRENAPSVIPNNTAISGWTQYGANTVVMSDDWKNYTNFGGNEDFWYKQIMARNVLHEILHTIGLGHPHAQAGDDCDDTPTYKPQCWEYKEDVAPPCNDWAKVGNNIMDYNSYTNWTLSNCQICIIHQELEKESSFYGQDKFVTDKGDCHRPVPFFKMPSVICLPDQVAFGQSPSIFIDATASTYETSYSIEVVEISVNGQEIPNTKKSKGFTGEIGRIDIASALSYPIKLNKTYKVILRVSNTCFSIVDLSQTFSTKSCIHTTATNNEDPLRSVLFYPNPNNGVINIEYETSLRTNTKIELIPLASGNSPILIKNRDIDECGNHYISYNLPETLANGSYTLRISTDEQVVNTLIQIER